MTIAKLMQQEDFETPPSVDRENQNHNPKELQYQARTRRDETT